MARGIEPADFVEYVVAEMAEFELHAELLERFEVLEQTGLDEGHRGCGGRVLMQSEANSAVRHHRVGMRPCVAGFGLGEAEFGVEVQGSPNIRRRDRKLQEPTKHWSGS